jgi:ferredoxin
MSDALRIRLDRTMCDGFGACAKHAPDYFSLDDWGYASLVGDGTVPESDRDAVMRALMDCPVHAIINMGEHRRSDDAVKHANTQEAPEPGPKSEDTEAVWGFVR